MLGLLFTNLFGGVFFLLVRKIERHYNSVNLISLSIICLGWYWSQHLRLSEDDLWRTKQAMKCKQDRGLRFNVPKFCNPSLDTHKMCVCLPPPRKTAYVRLSSSVKDREKRNFTLLRVLSRISQNAAYGGPYTGNGPAPPSPGALMRGSNTPPAPCALRAKLYRA